MSTILQYQEINLSLNNEKKAIKDVRGFLIYLLKFWRKWIKTNKDLIQCLKRSKITKFIDTKTNRSSFQSSRLNYSVLYIEYGVF
ncbi:unnamed protein product [Paramecium pentaurelia]|uniref:Uncharacterized protein n=1 Tax=Paramecium pentaurelia TaxID=43138 RepID=A0A8S1WE37_9CILI|nr:unnamed protein product [Paramecium pentaurelia]